MAAITASMVAALRAKTDAPMMECKRALTDADGDADRAEELLRVKLGNEHAWQPQLHKIQKDLMDMMSHLARPSEAKKLNTNPMPTDGAQFCEEWID